MSDAPYNMPLASAVLEFSKLTLIHDLAVIMLVAGFIAIVFQRFGWPKVVGYIVAGAIMGLPAVAHYTVNNRASIDILANLGVLFLMFSLGLELNIRKLQRIGGIIFPTAILDILLMIGAGYFTGRHILGWGMLPSLFMGAVICDSSTTLLAKSLDEIGCSKEHFASVIFGTTLFEDILTIGVMALLSGLALTGQFQASGLIKQLAYVMLFLVGVMLLGLTLLPKYLERISKKYDSETILLVILGICIGTSFVAEYLQFNLALGAFLVGAVVSESSLSLKINAKTEALRNMFSTVFFVTIGLMLDLTQVWACKWEILLLTLLVLVGKTLNCAVGSFFFGLHRNDAIRTGIGLAQIGDFSYMVALMGIQACKTDPTYTKLYQIAVGTSIITTLINPFLLKGAQKFVFSIEPKLPKAFTQLLDQWTEKVNTISKRAKHGDFGPQFKKEIILFLLKIAVIAIIFCIGHSLVPANKHWTFLPNWLKDKEKLLVWLTCCVCTTPCILSIFFHIKTLANLIVDATIPLSFNARWATYMRNLSFLIYRSIGIGIVVVEIILFSLSLFPDPTVAILSVATALIPLFTFRKLFLDKVKAQADIEQKMLSDLMDTSKKEVDKTISTQVYTRLAIPENSGAIGMTLGTLRLPNRTGVSVARIIRRNGVVVEHLQADTQIYKGDTLEMNATEQQYLAAADLLAQKEIPQMPVLALSDMLDLQIKGVTLPEDSPAVGHSLQDLKLRNATGVTVIRAVFADNTFVDNPAANLVFSPGDTIFILGNQEQLQKATNLLTNAPQKPHLNETD